MGNIAWYSKAFRRFRIDSHVTRAIDWIDFLILGCLGSFGLFILLSINQTLFLQQLSYLVVALLFLLIVSNLDLSVLTFFAPFGYIGSILLLLLSYAGPVIRGATRWIVISGVQLQPSELVKPLLLLAFAFLMASYPPRNVRNILMHLVLFLVPFLLIFKQPDLGTSLVYALSWLAMMVASGFPFRVFILLSVIVALMTPVLWGSLHEYQKARVLTFVNPHIDPKGAGYNALQSMIAVGSGQLFGRGLGRGTQSHLRFLPEYHTDFIFATLVEEFGFFGGVLLLLGYTMLLLRIILPLLRGTVKNLLPYVYCVGLFAMLLSQVFINAGMNMGVIPITGITLPFVSYGGSSLLSIGIAFGILSVLRRSERERLALR